MTDLRITRASVALADKFASRHGAQKACSTRTDIRQDRLSKLASGKAFPRADESYLLEEHEGIPGSWWAQDPIEDDSAA